MAPPVGGGASFANEFPRAELIIVSVYLVCATLWILISDRVLDSWEGDPSDPLPLQTYKGLNFVFTTAALLYLVLRRSFTRRRRAEALSRELSDRFELAARAATDAIWDWDPRTDHLGWSDGFRRLFGYDLDGLELSLEAWTSRIHPDDRERVRAGFVGVVRGTGDSWTDECRLRRADGTYAYVHARGYVMRDGAGQAIRMVGGITDVTERRQAQETLERSRKQLRALSARVETSREEERTRISREIHDELGQMLTGLKMDLRWIEKRLGQQPGNPALNSILDKAVEAGELADATLASVQRIAAELRPGVLDNLGLATAIKHEAARFQERTGMICRLRLPDHALALTSHTATAVFRIFQETLTNVARHSGASEVGIELRLDGAEVVLEVRDNGRGVSEAELASPRSLGLLGMKERAARAGGGVNVAPAANGGTTVILRLPAASEPGLMRELL
jgi:two-component system, NarL family, sensor histidine kinase UhpB